MTNGKKHITLLGIVTSLYWFSMYAYVPTFPPYLESIGASDMLIGLIVGSYGFTQMLIRIPLGIISDKLNRRKVFVVSGIFLGLLSGLGMWFFDNVYLVLAFRSIAGVAAATWVAYSVLFSSYYKSDETPKAIGIINSFTKLGQVTAMLLGGIIAQRFGQQSPFLMAAIGGAIGLVLSSGVEEKRDINHKPLKLKELLSVARNFSLLSVSFLAIIFQLIVFATTFGFIPLVAKHLGASDLHLGLIATVSAIPAIFSSSLSGTFFTPRFGEKKTIMGGFIVMALATIVVPYVGSLPLLFLSQIVGGFGRGLVFPVLMGLSIKNIIEKKRATAMGFFQAIYGLGMFIGPVLLGVLSDTVGIETGFWVVGLIGICGAILAMVFCGKKYCDV